jgi:RNA recognition motif-containing protein
MAIPFPIGLSADGQSCGYAHVEYDSQEQAEKAFDAHQEAHLSVWNRRLHIDFAQVLPLNRTRLFLRRFHGTSTELRQAFAQFAGSIRQIRQCPFFFNLMIEHFLIPDSVTHPQSRNPTGVAFIQFINEESAKAALDTLGGRETQNGVKLFLSYAHQREDAARDETPKPKRGVRRAKQTDPFGLQSL